MDPARLAAELYRAALRIRRVAERIRDLYAAGRMPGFIHLSLGQAGVAAGACLPLRRDGYVTSTHRGHGHYLAKGGSLPGLLSLSARDGTLQVTVFPDEEAHRIPVGLPDFKSGVGL